MRHGRHFDLHCLALVVMARLPNSNSADRCVLSSSMYHNGHDRPFIMVLLVYQSVYAFMMFFDIHCGSDAIILPRYIFLCTRDLRSSARPLPGI